LEDAVGGEAELGDGQEQEGQVGVHIPFLTLMERVPHCLLDEEDDRQEPEKHQESLGREDYPVLEAAVDVTVRGLQ